MFNFSVEQEDESEDSVSVEVFAGHLLKINVNYNLSACYRETLWDDNTNVYVFDCIQEELSLYEQMYLFWDLQAVTLDEDEWIS